MIINWAPADEPTEIRQCVAAVLATSPGTVPFARTLGVEGLLDTPTPAAAQRMRAAAVRSIQAWERRVRVKRVTVAADEHGHMQATATIEEV